MTAYANFTPGPSQLYFTVEGHVKAAFREGVPSLSHRSKTFEGYYRSVAEGLRALLNLPAHYHIFFTASATEVWERAIQNLVARQSFHFVNGSFSKRFYEIALQLQREAKAIEVPAGHGFDQAVNIPAGTELIAVTHNETSTGVTMPLEYIYNLRRQHPDALLVVDAVSSLPFPDFDYTQVDSVFFSVQKGFGLPAGLGVWMVNDRCLAKAEQLLASGQSIGSYHNIPSLLTHAQKFQTPETPNVLAIYLLGKVVEDMVQKGITAIRRETIYKSTILYQALEQHSKLNPFVQDTAWRSPTVVVADCGTHTEELARHLQAHGLFPGDGYGPFKKSQLRFANFPTHSREQFERLVDLITAW